MQKHLYNKILACNWKLKRTPRSKEIDKKTRAIEPGMVVYES